MIPTAPSLLLISFACGLWFADCTTATSPQPTRAIRAQAREELWLALSFSVLILWPIAIYFALSFSDWSWMYFLDPRRLPTGTTLLFLLGLSAAMLFGFATGLRLVPAQRKAFRIGLASAWLFSIGLVWLLRWRIFFIGSYGGYHQPKHATLGLVELFRHEKIAWAWLIANLGILFAVGVVSVTLRDLGRRFRAE